MAHLQQLTFVKTISEHLTKDYRNVKILEIGSYDVNGSIRKFFLNSEYIGVDLIDRPFVDIISDGHLINHKIINMTLQFHMNVLNIIHIGLRLLKICTE